MQKPDTPWPPLPVLTKTDDALKEVKRNQESGLLTMLLMLGDRQRDGFLEPRYSPLAVNLRDKEPVYRKQFRLAVEYRSQLIAHLENWMKLGVVSLRPVLDFREVNEKSLQTNAQPEKSAIAWTR